MADLYFQLLLEREKVLTVPRTLLVSTPFPKRISFLKCGQHHRTQERLCPARLSSVLGCFLPVGLWLACTLGASSQTTSTGAVTGIAFDSSGAILPGVTVKIVSQNTDEEKLGTSDENGRFSFLLLTPGRYRVLASKADFEPATLENLVIHVTETVRLELHLRPAGPTERSDVAADSLLVQVDSVTLGRVVNERAVSGLPLVTRNFAQIASLSPGVSAGVYNAGELGLGGIAQSQIAASNDGIFVHGARSYDNNFQLDGISVSDVQGSAGGSGGIPLPNPDSIQEFKVQTALYDAAYGRYGGANVSLITKTGSPAFHGSVFEFFRNEALNANDFFLSQIEAPRPVLRENQFGFVLGGPIKKDKLHFFGSYQGTRQVNGIAAGQSRTACTANLIEPPLTDDRSASALGQLFGGMTGAHGGVAINPDGTNINDAALALLNLRLPDGSLLIPTPQSIDPTKPFSLQGFAALSDPCHFSEDQFSTNVDYMVRPNSQIAARFFFANNDQLVTFPGNGVNPSGNIPGFLSPSDSAFRVFSLAHTYTFSNKSLNEARIGYARISTDTQAQSPFKWSDIGVAEGEMSHNNELPSLRILGSVSIASGFPREITQNSFVFSDDFSLVRGPHNLRFGGSLTRLQDNVNLVGLGAGLRFLSWPDFLLGLSANDNGSAFSNVFASFDDFGLSTREYRAWEGSLFAQDDYRVLNSLTLNFGLRYERLGQFEDRLGRNASFDLRAADPNPPASGSTAGYMVASNFPGELPSCVIRANNTFGNDGLGQNAFGPRMGFAWQPWPSKTQLVLRGGYGMFYSRPTGQAFYQNLLGAPFSVFRLNAGESNAEASFQAPFPQPFPTPQSFPLFPAYSPTTTTTIYSTAPAFQPAIIQQYSLNAQTALREHWLLEIAYVGTRGTHLVRQRSLNQALSASPEQPIRGITSNTIENIPQRVPLIGVPPDSLQLMESEGSSWYNGLELSLTKRLSRGLQFLASYTFSKTLDTDGADINSTSSGNALTLGDQNSPGQRWGRPSFDRTHRIVLSETWNLPSPSRGLQRAFFGGWDLAAVVTIQSGTALTIADTNANNVFGISEDRAQLSGNCSKTQLLTAGGVRSRLNDYFKSSCFTTPPVIGADGIGTGFGNSSTGIVTGPGQSNFDLAASKEMTLNRLHENTTLTFRAEFYNAFNHPQFANPDSNLTSPTFGVISSTSVNPRVIQLALRLEL